MRNGRLVRFFFPPVPFLPILFILPVPNEVSGLSLLSYRNIKQIPYTRNRLVAKSGFHLRCA